MQESLKFHSPADLETLNAAAGWGGSSRAAERSREHLIDGTEPVGDPLVLIETGPEGIRERVLPPDAVVVQGIEADGTDRRVVTEVISDGPEPVIVELRSRPLLKRPSIRRLGGLQRGTPEVARAVSQLAAEHARVRAKVVGIAERRRGRALRSSQVVRGEFSKVFNGFAARLSRAEQEEILRLADVRAVHADPEVRATLDVSGPLIGAPQVWSEYGFTGEGTVIAIIDTGVDYTHTDLGGCLGPGCKVLGGFDFYNNDADPMDDNGHGTHCAGIAAGTHPVLRGVAPGAKLLAYKVLNSSGSGDGSLVIAGMERAVDPDGDGDTSDRADVISMSLGGQDTQEDDPLIQAAENASAAGVVVVAAAGNSGGFFTILTPGAAPSVVTVGATDDLDRRASFSSRGPANRTLLIKPEIAAPGVAICSTRGEGTGLGPTCLDQVHIAISGTSMATPHVAGSAALVRGLNPDLTPAEVKSLLVNNAMELPFGVMEVGAGRVDIPAAAAAQTILEPATLGFGDSDTTQDIWTVHRTLEVRNRGEAAGSYSLGTTELPEGVQLNLTPSEFSLVGGASIAVDVDLIVDNATVPGVGALPFAHDGAVLVDSGSQVQRIPFAFMKQPPVLRLEFDVTPIAVMIHDRDSFARFIGSPGVPVFDVQVPTGILDVMVLFPKAGDVVRPVWVVREGIPVTGNTTSVSISRDEAQHAISHVIRDADGVLIESTHRMHTLQYKPTGFAVTMFMTGSPQLPRTGFGANDISSDYSLGVALHAPLGDDDYFLLNGLEDGVSSSVNLDADATSMTRLVSRFHPRLGEGPVRGGATLWRRASLFASGLSFARENSSFERNFYLTPVPRKPYFFSVAPFVTQVAQSFPRLTTSHSLEPALTRGTVDLLARPFLSDVVHRNEGGQLPMNLGPFFWQLATDNSSDSISLRDPIASVEAPIAFFSQGAGIPEAIPGEGGTVLWELYSDATLVDSGVLSQTRLAADWRRESSQPEGSYRLISRGPLYAVGEASGITEVELAFDTTVPSSGPYDPNPPTLRLLEIVREGALTNKLAPDRPATVAVEVSDDAPNHDSTGIDTVVVTYSTASGGVTVEASRVDEGRYEAAIACDPGLGSLTVVVTDQAGNSHRQEFTPAFSCRVERCGDGVVDFAEQCDDGNDVSCDGCSASCQIDGICGNGVLETGCEQCDDGNTGSCDGCSATCALEGVCGDGVFEPDCEMCDDGNLETGDCCSPTCEIEPRFTVCRPPAGPCDVLEFCSGSGGFCPPDVWRPGGTTCRPPLSACDQAEICTGLGPHCPTDSFLPNGASCDDGVFCNGPDRCSGGTCSLHSGDPCGVPSECRGCDERIDSCFDPEGGACSDDGNVCTDDFCDGVGGCIHPANSARCNDPCTQDGVCRGGQCTPGLIPVVCTAVDACHLPGTCSPATGLCSNLPKSNGASCDDGNRCTGADACLSGVCRGGILPDGDGDGVCDLVDACIDDVDTDGDGIGDLCDNCPGDYNLDQRNADGSGGGDVCDPCPVNGDTVCEHAQSAGQTLGPAGGTVATPDGKVRIEVPPGALEAPTSLSITEALSEFGGSSSRLLLRTELTPDGQRLDPSATVILRWQDEDGDGDVDGVAPLMAEQDLRVWRNGLEIAGPCGDPVFQSPQCTVACCDPSANTWILETSHFGQYVVGEPVGMWIPGSRAQIDDCILEWEVMDPREAEPMSEEGVPNSKRTCVDGDVTCDADGEVNGSCAFVVAACVNVEDRRYLRDDGAPLCLASDVERVVLKNPRPSDRKPWKAKVANQLLGLFQALGPSSASRGSALHSKGSPGAAPRGTGSDGAVDLDEGRDRDPSRICQQHRCRRGSTGSRVPTSAVG
jgi:cysteine-rich repeat protein